jgi:hypothetical protein
MAEMRLAVVRLNQRTVVDDHGERGIEHAGDGHSEIVATAGDQCDFDATAGGFGDGAPIGGGKLPSAVQERAVNIERDKPHGHIPIIEGSRAICRLSQGAGRETGS